MRAVLLLLALVATAHAQARRSTRPSFDPATVYKVPRGAAPSEGPADAPVTVVVWSDFACGYCNRVQATLDEVRRMFPEQIRWIHRTLPLDEDNTVAAEAALAANAQGRFVPMKDRLYGLVGRVDRVAVELIARELGLDMVRFRADLDTHAYRGSIAADVADARALGVSGTPTFFVDGRPVHGNQPLKVFVETVEQELARAAGTHATGDLYEALVASGKLVADAPSDIINHTEGLDQRLAYHVGTGLPGHQLGPDDALVTIVEWSDFQCPYCEKTQPILAQIHAKYGNAVRIIYRHFPVQGHRNAQLAAEAAVAAAEQGKFWAFHDQIWAHFGSLAREDLESFAKEAGLDLPKFRAALDDRRYHDTVMAEASMAASLGVDGTPTLFVNGYPVQGSPTADGFDALIASRVAQAQNALRAGLPASDIYGLIMSDAEGTERADPSRIPSVSTIHLELRPEERSRAVAAACRRHDAPRALDLAKGLVGDPRRQAASVCVVEGVDLPKLEVR
jgi:protein-disulfide isomerase